MFGGEIQRGNEEEEKKKPLYSSISCLCCASRSIMINGVSLASFSPDSLLKWFQQSSLH